MRPDFEPKSNHDEKFAQMLRFDNFNHAAQTKDGRMSDG